MAKSLICFSCGQPFAGVRAQYCPRCRSLKQSHEKHQYNELVRERRETAPSFGEWLLTAPDLDDDGQTFRDLVIADPAFPGTSRALVPIRRYLVEFGMAPDDPIVNVANAVWRQYNEALFGDIRPKEPTLYGEDCGKVRGPKSKRWCGDCSPKHSAVHPPEVRQAAAMKRSRTASEQAVLAAFARRLLEGQGLDVASVIQSLLDERLRRDRNGQST